tara:strand:+ start:240 stop:905 length:666 start_codon:yes stop_codon:yes gene_type:complete
MRKQEPLTGKWEADNEFREKYHVPHPPATVYRLYDCRPLGQVWGLSHQMSSRDLVNDWEWFREPLGGIGPLDGGCIKPALQTLEHSDLTIDWCSQWGLSSHQLAHCSREVLAYETNQCTMTVAETNLRILPSPPGSVVLTLIPTLKQNLSSAISSVPWHQADIIRIGSRSAAFIIQSIREVIKAHTLIVEPKDQFLNELIESLGFKRKNKRNCNVWYKKNK